MYTDCHRKRLKYCHFEGSSPSQNISRSTCTATLAIGWIPARIIAAGSDLVDGQQREKNHEEGAGRHLVIGFHDEKADFSCSGVLRSECCADGERHGLGRVDPPLNIHAERERSTNINHPRL
ncbi:hypothetical protein MJO28_009216, partial [Puccinia striiformis f. sp. tritici]